MIEVTMTRKDAAIAQAERLALWQCDDVEREVDQETSISQPHLLTGRHRRTNTRFKIAVETISTV
jgi:hypothetical protein